MRDVPSGKFRLKGQSLKETARRLGITNKKGEANRHQVSLRAGVSYPTIDKYFEDYEDVESIHLQSLAGILVDAFETAPEDVLDMRFGDLFDYISTNGRD